MNAKVWVLGDAVVDLLPESGGRLLQCPGGAPANVAVGIARLGGNSGFIGRVGDDPLAALCSTLCARNRWIPATCAAIRSTGPLPWWSISTAREKEPLPLWFAPARTCFTAGRPSALRRQRMAARLLHCAQRRTQPQHHLRGDGENKISRRSGQL